MRLSLISDLELLFVKREHLRFFFRRVLYIYTHAHTYRHNNIYSVSLISCQSSPTFAQFLSEWEYPLSFFSFEGCSVRAQEVEMRIWRRREGWWEERKHSRIQSSRRTHLTRRTHFFLNQETRTRARTYIYTHTPQAQQQPRLHWAGVANSAWVQ